MTRPDLSMPAEQALAAGIAAVIAEREADGEPYWVERWGDLIAPDPRTDPRGIRR